MQLPGEVSGKFRSRFEPPLLLATRDTRLEISMLIICALSLAGSSASSLVSSPSKKKSRIENQQSRAFIVRGNAYAGAA